MSFIQAGFLFAFAAVAIPLVVHLLNRWQVRQIELGTMRFLQEIVRDGARRRTIRRWFLLLTRIALVTLMALMFARPYLAERTRRDGDRVRVILIDRSASMGMPGKNGRLIDDAVAAAMDQAQELGEDAKLLWAWFDRQVVPMSASTVRPTAPRALAGDTDYMAAFDWARLRIDDYPDSLADVVLITDLQQSGLGSDERVSDAVTFPSDVPVRVIDVGRPAANNLAITHVAAPAKRFDAGANVLLGVTLFNFGTLPIEEATLSTTAFDGKRTMRWRKTIDVPSGQAQDVTFELGKLDRGIWQITAAIDVDDDLATDNRRVTALEIAEPTDVLVLDDGATTDGASAKSHCLVAALEQSDHQQSDHQQSDHQQGETDHEESPQGRFRAEVVHLKDQAFPVLEVQSHRLVVVVDAGALSTITIQPLEKYVRSGGRLLVFSGDPGEHEQVVMRQWQQSGLAPGELQLPQRSGVMPFRIVSVSRGNAMLAPFEDPQHGDLSRLAFQKVQPVTVRDSTEVLAWFDKDRAAITQHVLDRGRVVWFLASADASWGSWTTNPLYLPLVQQMAGDLLNMTGEGGIRFRSIGDPSPSAELVFSQPGFDTRPEAMYVVNGTAKESDPTRIDVTQFAEHFSLTLADATGSVIQRRVESEKRHELWPWFAAGLLVLLVGEFALANRTTA